MSGEDNDPPTNGGNETGHGGQGQPQGGQQPPQGGQQPPQGGQGAPQGNQVPPQGGQGAPQGGQQPPQGGKGAPQAGQYGQPQGYGGPSTMDKLMGMFSESATSYLILGALLSLIVGFGAGLAEGLSSFLDGPQTGPLLLSRLTAGNATAVGEVALPLAFVAAGAVLLVKTTDEDTATLAATAGLLSFVSAFVFSLFVSMGVIMTKTANNFVLPSIADALIGSILIAFSGLIVGVVSVFVVRTFDPNEQPQRGAYQQPPQGGQGPR